MRKIAEIIETIRAIKSLKSEAQVASALKMKPQALNNHKIRGTYPFEQLIVFCQETGISFDYFVLDREDPEELKNDIIKLMSENDDLVKQVEELKEKLYLYKELEKERERPERDTEYYPEDDPDFKPRKKR